MVPFLHALLLARANAEGRESRRDGAPLLAHNASADEIATWLQWCDPNGCHTPARALAEGFDPYDYDGAIDALASMLAEAS